MQSVTFVGTPNRGTPFCNSDHLASYVDAIANLLSALPDNGVTDAVDCVVGVLSHVARQMYKGIPGAMSMDPTGDYLKALDAKPHPSDCVYRVIASEFEPIAGSDWKRRLRDLVVDKVFVDKPNDLIVPTDPDWEPNRVSQRLILDKSNGVDHSTYWTNEKVLNTLPGIRGGAARSDTWRGCRSGQGARRARRAPSPPKPCRHRPRRRRTMTTPTRQPSRSKSCTRVSSTRAIRSWSATTADRLSKARKAMSTTGSAES